MADMDLFAPLRSLRWVDRTELRANDYNPNKVSEENLRLLTQSILANGWTLPIVFGFVTLCWICNVNTVEFNG